MTITRAVNRTRRSVVSLLTRDGFTPEDASGLLDLAADFGFAAASRAFQGKYSKMAARYLVEHDAEDAERPFLLIIGTWRLAE